MIVDNDSLRRASLARSLVTAGWDVRTASSHDEVLSASRHDQPTAVVVAVEHPTVEGIVRAGVAHWPAAAVVLHGDLGQASARLLDFLLGLRQVRVCSRDEPLLDRVDALVEELRRAQGLPPGPQRWSAAVRGT